MVEHARFWNRGRETMPADEVRGIQDRKVRRTVRDAYANAPIVRELWDEAGVAPDDIDGVEDLDEAPVFRKDDSRDRMIETGEPFGGRLRVPTVELHEEGALVCTSSGTTGVSTNIAFTERDLGVAAECQARSLWAMGLRPGDTFFSWALPNHLAIETWKDGARELGASVTMANHSPAEAGRAVHVLEYLEPSVVEMVSGPLIGALEDHYDENGLDPREVWSPVDSVVFGGEPLFEDTRNRIEDDWGVEVFELSGGLEPGWFLTECGEHGRWLHIPDDHFYVEALDPETGERVEEGRGELAVTALSYEGMAHVRWAHDDIVEITREACDCGRTGTRVKFMGRVGDLVRVGDRDVLPLDVLALVRGVEEMPNDLFQFYTSSTDELRMNIGYEADRTDDPGALAAELEDRIESELGIPVRIVDTVTEAELLELGPPHKIPRIAEE